MISMQRNTEKTVFHINDLYEGNENGIWLDFRQNTFLFIVKDTIWTNEEIRSLHCSDINVSFIKKGIIDAFVVEVFDCLEASDLPFYVKDGDDEFIRALSSAHGLSYELLLINGDNRIVAVRHAMFSATETKLLKEHLLPRLKEETDGTMFHRAYEKLTMHYEPYELLQFSVFQTKSDRK